MTDTQNLRVIYLIKRVELLVRTRLERSLRDLGVTAGQYAVLSLLALMPEASSAQIARSVGVTPQTMAETITAFEQQHLIRREQSSKHKRILEISLTDNGLALLKECDVRARRAEAELFSNLGSKDLAQLRGILNRILSTEEQSSAA
jgi:DNA-binding MarR family transcriptional regulator